MAHQWQYSSPAPSDFLGTSNNSPLIIKTNNLERLRIDANGNVGIGTNSPQYKLDVCGTIRSKEWIVETSWCDFVFESTYQKMNWKDKKEFHIIHKHLPYLPSTKEIERNGFRSEYLKGMMQNIEEDRLDIEELFEKQDKLEKGNQELKKILSKQEKELMKTKEELLKLKKH